MKKRKGIASISLLKDLEESLNFSHIDADNLFLEDSLEDFSEEIKREIKKLLIKVEKKREEVEEKLEEALKEAFKNYLENTRGWSRDLEIPEGIQREDFLQSAAGDIASNLFIIPLEEEKKVKEYILSQIVSESFKGNKEALGIDILTDYIYDIK